MQGLPSEPLTATGLMVRWAAEVPAKGLPSAHGPAVFHSKGFLFITSFSSLEQHQAQEDGGRGLCKLMSNQIKHVLSACNLFQLIS